MADAAQAFRDMAARIDKIEAAEFAGAVVIVPAGDGEPIAFLTTDPHPDLAQFWATVETRVLIRKNEVLEAAQATPMGWRR